MLDFDFTQAPRAPLTLPLYPFPANTTTVTTTASGGSGYIPIPGFTVESIVIGSMLGVATLMLIHRKKRTKKT
jgi:hypothetical protein